MALLCLFTDQHYTNGHPQSTKPKQPPLTINRTPLLVQSVLLRRPRVGLRISRMRFCKSLANCWTYTRPSRARKEKQWGISGQYLTLRLTQSPLQMPIRWMRSRSSVMVSRRRSENSLLKVKWLSLRTCKVSQKIKLWTSWARSGELALSLRTDFTLVVSDRLHNYARNKTSIWLIIKRLVFNIMKISRRKFPEMRQQSFLRPFRKPQISSLVRRSKLWLAVLIDVGGQCAAMSTSSSHARTIYPLQVLSKSL